MSEERPRQLQIFLSFLKLGCLAFGGPVAHLGYFQEEFVRKRKWISESRYADLVALCQFLPGPASSQVGFAVGHHRGGVSGAFFAWIGFTLPSALIMIGLALGLSAAGDFRGAGWIAGLKLTAVAVVANAIWSMASKLCPDRGRALIAGRFCSPPVCRYATLATGSTECGGGCPAFLTRTVKAGTPPGKSKKRR